MIYFKHKNTVYRWNVASLFKSGLQFIAVAVTMILISIPVEAIQ